MEISNIKQKKNQNGLKTFLKKMFHQLENENIVTTKFKEETIYNLVTRS